MTREEAKQLIKNMPYIKAFSEGKIIEVNFIKMDGGKVWKEMDNIHFDSEPEYYRIKPEPQYRLNY
jgi:hypothetical protein